ncbi:hypothetical protein EV193_10613 [Herbihabitans rhizosphaerae]|uniref:Secreted protein n=1 Tax=Herbihabitans rhizosphaerae TaxID=1872711 RepID=A0A4Q7KJQ3_9PSEU|nr:hypothetical protein [Herbihabitans rhizosphaerae]RZS36779.1 hypothetical protein EV193_10613 [Herbihabitans rhizosphaerae]
MNRALRAAGTGLAGITLVVAGAVSVAAQEDSSTTTTTPKPTTTTSKPTTTTSSSQPGPDLVWLRLSAYSGYPGEKVSVAAACDRGEVSPLTAVALRQTEPFGSNPDGHQPWAFFAETVIKDVKPGSYPVSFHCGGDPVTQHFTVLERKQGTQVKEIPQGPVDTGGGGTATIG